MMKRAISTLNGEVVASSFPENCLQVLSCEYYDVFRCCDSVVISAFLNGLEYP